MAGGGGESSRRRGEKASRRRRLSESPPSSDDSELDSVKSERTERVVTRSQSQREVAVITWSRLARGFRRGVRSASCRGVGVAEGARKVSNKPAEIGQNVVVEVVADKGKGPAEIAEGGEGEGGQDVSVIPGMVVDPRSLESSEFVSTIESSLVKLDKLMAILNGFSGRATSPSFTADEGASLLGKMPLLMEKANVLNNMLAQAVNRLEPFPSIIVESLRVYEYLRIELPKQTQLLVPDDSPVLGELYKLAREDGFCLFSFSYL